MTSLRDVEMQAPVVSPPTMGWQNLLVSPRAWTPSFLLPITSMFRHPAPCPASAQRRGQPEGFSIFQVDSLSTVQKEQKQSQWPLKYCASEIVEWWPSLPQGAPVWSWQPLPPVHWHGLSGWHAAHRPATSRTRTHLHSRPLLSHQLLLSLC